MGFYSLHVNNYLGPIGRFKTHWMTSCGARPLCRALRWKHVNSDSPWIKGKPRSHPRRHCATHHHCKLKYTKYFVAWFLFSLNVGRIIESLSSFTYEMIDIVPQNRKTTWAKSKMQANKQSFVSALPSMVNLNFWVWPHSLQLEVCGE